MLIPEGPFLESPEILRAHFGEHNSHCIFKTNASQDTKLYNYLIFYFLYNISVKRPALQKKWIEFLPIAFRARKDFGTFEKRAPYYCEIDDTRQWNCKGLVRSA